MRLQDERISVGPQFDVIVPNMFAGSVLDLEHDTEYEVRFEISDPDGVNGESTKTVTTQTRAEPMPAEDGRVFHVYPPDFRRFTGFSPRPNLFGITTYTNYTSSDYNGFGPTPDTTMPFRCGGRFPAAE
mgnify:CR=1 FL=1